MHNVHTRTRVDNLIKFRYHFFLRSFCMWRERHATDITARCLKMSTHHGQFSEWNKKRNIDSVSLNAGNTHCNAGSRKSSSLRCQSFPLKDLLQLMTIVMKITMQHDYHIAVWLSTQPQLTFEVKWSERSSAENNRRKIPVACTDAIETSTSTDDKRNVKCLQNSRSRTRRTECEQKIIFSASISFSRHLFAYCVFLFLLFRSKRTFVHIFRQYLRRRCFAILILGSRKSCKQ